MAHSQKPTYIIIHGDLKRATLSYEDTAADALFAYYRDENPYLFQVSPKGTTVYGCREQDFVVTEEQHYEAWKLGSTRAKERSKEVDSKWQQLNELRICAKHGFAVAQKKIDALQEAVDALGGDEYTDPHAFLRAWHELNGETDPEDPSV